MLTVSDCAVRCAADEYDPVVVGAGEAFVLARSKLKNWLRSLVIAVVNESSFAMASDASKSKLSVVRNWFTNAYSGDCDPNRCSPMCLVTVLATTVAAVAVSVGHAASKAAVSDSFADFTSAKISCGVVVGASGIEQTLARIATMRLAVACRAVCSVMLDRMRKPVLASVRLCSAMDCLNVLENSASTAATSASRSYTRVGSVLCTLI